MPDDSTLFTLIQSSDKRTACEELRVTHDVFLRAFSLQIEQSIVQDEQESFLVKHGRHKPIAGRCNNVIGCKLRSVIDRRTVPEVFDDIPRISFIQCFVWIVLQITFFVLAEERKRSALPVRGCVERTSTNHGHII